MPAITHPSEVPRAGVGEARLRGRGGSSSVGLEARSLTRQLQDFGTTVLGVHALLA